MSISRTPSGRLDLTQAYSFKDVVFVEVDGKYNVYFKVDWVGRQRGLIINRQTTDATVIDMLDQHTYDMVHRGDSWWSRMRRVFGSQVGLSLREVAGTTAYALPVDRSNERYDRSPQPGETLYILPRRNDIATVGCRVGIVTRVSV